MKVRVLTVIAAPIGNEHATISGQLSLGSKIGQPTVCISNIDMLHVLFGADRAVCF
jgi:hypothetical protein